MKHYVVRFDSEDQSGNTTPGLACVLGDLKAVEAMLKKHLSDHGLAIVGSCRLKELRDIQRNGELTASIASLAQALTRSNPISYEIFHNDENQNPERTPWYPALPSLLVINCIQSQESFKKICDEKIEFTTITSFVDRWLGASFPSTIGIPISSWSPVFSKIVELASSHYFVSPLPEDFTSTDSSTIIELIASPGFSLTDPFEPEASKLSLGEHSDNETVRSNYTVSELFEGAILPLGRWSVNLNYLDLSKNLHEAEEVRSGMLLPLACRCAIQQVYKIGRVFSGINPQIPLNTGIPLFGSEVTLLELEQKTTPSLLRVVRNAITCFPNQIEYVHIRIFATAICFAVGKNALRDAEERWNELAELSCKEGMVLENLSSLFLSEYMM